MVLPMMVGHDDIVPILHIGIGGNTMVSTLWVLEEMQNSDEPMQKKHDEK